MSKKQIKTSDPATDNKMVIVYDGECPFCRSYVRLAALKTAIGNVDLVDARSPAPAVRELTARGYDLNEGMAAIYGGKVYYGSDAVVLISSITSERGRVAYLLALLLRNPVRARLLYPIMKVGRRIALRIRGKPLI